MPKLNIHDPKVQAGAAVVAAVIAFALYKAHAGSSAALGTTTADPTGAASALGDANMQDAVYGSLENQLASLQGIVTQLQNTPPPAASSAVPPPVEGPAPTVVKPTATAIAANIAAHQPTAAAVAANKAAHQPTAAAIAANRVAHGEPATPLKPKPKTPARTTK